ncbi:MAG TPA: phosphoribosylamine--glycine ligase [Acidimicrobiales bacterium]|nr:phosphoribosylamine--glycine ligase [Acidimicrobiales bacterium]
MGRRTTVCVVGSGGREHALALALARSADVVVTPGNPGMETVTADGYRVAVTPARPDEVEADLVVIGPEAPLVDGLADRLRARGRRVVGPGADGARLEGSKAFMKELLDEAGVPTARFGTFDRVDEAQRFLRMLPGPWVVKTDGPAAGKGVLVATSLEEAEADVAAKLAGGAFGEAGRRVVVEEGLTGPECSLLVLCDGRRVVPLAPAQDFKRVGDGDTGPNTGGMGAYCPMPDVDDGLVDELLFGAVEPLVAALRARGVDYRGVLYAGLMLTPDGPKVLEYNVRFGDPETQAVLPRLADDPVDLLMAVAEGRLSDVCDGRPAFTDDAAVCVVMAAAGYPTAPRTGDPISGLGPDGQLADPVPGVTVFHAGTRRPDAAGPFVTAGGRVLGVTALAPTVADARRLAYEATGAIGWDGALVRRDIAAAAAGPPPPAGTNGMTGMTGAAGTNGTAGAAGTNGRPGGPAAADGRTR